MTDSIFLIAVLGAILLAVTGVAVKALIEWWTEYKRKQSLERLVPIVLAAVAVVIGALSLWAEALE